MEENTFALECALNMQEYSIFVTKYEKVKKVVMGKEVKSGKNILPQNDILNTRNSIKILYLQNIIIISHTFKYVW